MKEIRIYKITDAGPMKDNDDGCYVVQHNDAAAVACIADGVSSQVAARFTSEFITGCVEDWYEEESERIFSSDPATVQSMMTNLVMNMHSDLIKEAKKRGLDEYNGFGSTIDLVVIGYRKMFVTHVGDSRVYLFNGTELQKITNDQTVAETEKATGLKYDRIAEEKKAHYLMQCVGVGEMTPTQYEVDIPPSCDILLCTDGLTNRNNDAALVAELGRPQSGADALCHLVTKARNEKEPDNITAVLIRRREKQSARKSPSGGE